jgi:hypothetical protein
VTVPGQLTLGLPGEFIFSGSGFREVTGHAHYKYTLKTQKCPKYSAAYAEGGPWPQRSPTTVDLPGKNYRRVGQVWLFTLGLPCKIIFQGGAPGELQGTPTIKIR